MGHIIRALTVAKEIEAHSDILFVTRSDSSVQNIIESSGFEVKYCRDDTDTIRLLSEIQHNTLVIDMPPVGETLMIKIKDSIHSKVVLFDGYPDASKWADIAVNGLINPGITNRRYWDDETKTHYFYGPRYLILREQFNDYKKEISKNPEEALRILLIFGGSDPMNLTTSTIKYLLKIPNHQFEITAVLGPKFAFNNELQETLEQLDTNKIVALKQNSSQIAELMWKSDITFVSPGLSLFESLVVGTPIIAIAQNELQRSVYNYYFENFSDIPKPFRFYKESFFLSPQDQSVKEMEIGKGRAEIIESIIR